MNTQLIKTNNSLILVSDEETKFGDWCYAKLSNNIFQNVNSNLKSEDKVKVLSQSPKLSKEVADEIGFIDVEELAKKEYPFALGGIGNSENDKKLSWIKGFQKLQELNQKKYSEAINLLQYFVDRVEKGEIRSKTTYQKYKDFLSQPQQWQVEAEEIDGVWNVTKIIK